MSGMAGTFTLQRLACTAPTSYVRSVRALYTTSTRDTLSRRGPQVFQSLGPCASRNVASSGSVSANTLVHVLPLAPLSRSAVRGASSHYSEYRHRLLRSGLFLRSDARFLGSTTPHLSPLRNTSKDGETKHDLHQVVTPPTGDGSIPRDVLRSASILTAGQFLANFSFGVIIPVLPAMATSMGLGALGVGVIISTPSAMRVLLNLSMGRLADLKGRRPLMILGGLATSIGSFGSGLAPGIMALLPARALVGVGSALSMAGSSAYMADLTEKVPEHRGRILGVQQTVITLAFVAGPGIGGLLASSYSPNIAFHVVGVCCFLSAMGYVALPETMKKRKDEVSWPEGIKSSLLGVFGSQNQAAGPGVKELLRDQNQKAIVLMSSLLHLCYGAQLSLVPLHALDVWQASPAELGMMFSAVSVVGLLGSPLGGWAADTFGRKATIVPSAILTATALGALPFVATKTAFFTAMGALTFGSSLLTPGLTAFTADVAPQGMRGQALSLSRQAGDVAFAVCPIVFGMMADVTSTGVTLGVASSMILVGSGVFAVTAKEAAKSV